jgi:uncharacterized protein YecT (DUF1311 family)
MFKKFSLYGFLIGSIFIGAHAGAESEDCEESDADIPVTLCGSAASPVALNICLDKALSKTNAALAKQYHRLLKDLYSQKNIPQEDFQAMKDTLIESQRAWQTYRVLFCDAELKRFGFGAGMGEAELQCRLKIARERVRYLTEYTNEIEPHANK